MKSRFVWLFFSVFFVVSAGNAQQTGVPTQYPGQQGKPEYEYAIETGIPYHEQANDKSDVYLKERCELDVYHPVGVTNAATIVWFHGGGLTGGMKEIPEALKNQGFVIVGVGYRLAPRVKAPVCIEDAAAATAWVLRHIRDFGGNPDRVFVSGHSAGGYLTLMIGLDKKYLSAYGTDANQLAGLIPLSPQCITHFQIRKEQGIPETQPVIDAYAPLFHVRADAPPLTLITGDREMEMLGRYEENAYMKRMMNLAGHQKTKLFELDGYGHNMVYPGIPLLLAEVRNMLEAKTGMAR